MRRYLPILLVLAVLAANEAIAQANAEELVCAACRDPHVYPDDFVNFAFNQVYGDESWLPVEQADDFFVSNLDGQRVYVDVDFVFYGIGFRGMRLPLWPRYLLHITLALPNGTIYEAPRSVFLHPLPVPAPGGPAAPADANDSTPSGSNHNGHHDDEDPEDEDYNDLDDFEWEDPEIDEPEGIVEIEDPDENGEFEDWCEEC